MSNKTATLLKSHHMNSYSFNKTLIPFPEPASDRIKPPNISQEITPTHVKSEQVKQELSLEEQAQEYMDAYRKAERIVVINFYTGGGAYKRGILDAIYRGFNPTNPQ